MMNGQSVEDAISACESVATSEPQRAEPSSDLESTEEAILANDIAMLIKAAKAGESLSAAWSGVRREWASRVYEHLRLDSVVVNQMLAGAGIDGEKLKRFKGQLKNLKRNGATGPNRSDQS